VAEKGLQPRKLEEEEEENEEEKKSVDMIIDQRTSESTSARLLDSEPRQCIREIEIERKKENKILHHSYP